MFERKLVQGRAYGTKAKTVYLECCEEFGWDKYLANEFGMMKPLFGHKAADGGRREVWFICHSNWYGDLLIYDTASGDVKHRNLISKDWSRIEEFQQEAPHTNEYPLQERITFAKNKLGQYVFLGVYRAKEPNSKSPDRVFELVSKLYPVLK